VDVYLIRHAEAVPETLDLPDPARHLSPTGRDQARALGERLRWHDCLPTLVWTSPLVRAVQTAELVIAGLAHGGPIDAHPGLALDGDVRAVAAALAALPDDASILLFGHEPSLSGLGGLLIKQVEFPALHKAEAVKLSSGAVRWRFAHDDDAPRPERARAGRPSQS
jgi:phosphohistidine phosphatase